MALSCVALHCRAIHRRRGAQAEEDRSGYSSGPDCACRSVPERCLTVHHIHACQSLVNLWPKMAWALLASLLSKDFSFLPPIGQLAKLCPNLRCRGPANQAAGPWCRCLTVSPLPPSVNRLLHQHLRQQPSVSL